jgi:hypothetical protein
MSNRGLVSYVPRDVYADDSRYHVIETETTLITGLNTP